MRLKITRKVSLRTKYVDNDPPTPLRANVHQSNRILITLFQPIEQVRLALLRFTESIPRYIYPNRSLLTRYPITVSLDLIWPFLDYKPAALLYYLLLSSERLSSSYAHYSVAHNSSSLARDSCSRSPIASPPFIQKISAVSCTMMAALPLFPLPNLRLNGEATLFRLLPVCVQITLNASGTARSHFPRSSRLRTSIG